MLLKYGRSKLALACFGKELNDRLAASPSTRHIVVHSLHPGSIGSGIFTSLYSRETPFRTVAVFIGATLSMTPKTGSKSVVKALLSDEHDRATRGGRYWNRVRMLRPLSIPVA